MKRIILISLLFLASLSAFAQGEDALYSDRIHVFGYIMTTDSLLPVRNTHVISKMAHCGTISNREGEFFISAKKIDTLWVSCIGFSRRLIPIDSTMADGDPIMIRLHRDTITLKEVEVKPWYDYETFKQMVIEMPTLPTPREIQRLNDELNDYWVRHPQLKGNGTPTITGSPIQYLYDKFNKSARRQARLLRNRRMFNEVLREQGRTDELLPDSLDYSIDYKIYELDEKADTVVKLSPQEKQRRMDEERKKYLRMPWEN